MGTSRGYVLETLVIRIGLRSLKVNILIGDNGCACLVDFSLFKVASNQSTATSVAMLGGAIRWMSPELFDPGKFGLSESFPTKESDCYALGMVIYEVLSGSVPFASYKEVVVISKVLEGHRPERPTNDFTDGIWEVVQRCWEPQPHDRIDARTALLGLEGDPTPLWLSSDLPDGDVETGSDAQSDTPARNSSMFSPFQFRLVFNRLRPMIGPSNSRGDGGLPNNPKGGRMGSWLARSARKILKATTRKPHGF